MTVERLYAILKDLPNDMEVDMDGSAKENSYRIDRDKNTIYIY